MDELKALVAVFGPVGGMALLGCWFLWRALNRRTDQLVDLGKASAEAMTRLAVQIEKKEP